jgi:hypothetical protein
MASSFSERLARTNRVEPTRLASLARLCGTLNYFLAQTESNITCEPCTNVTWSSKFLRLAILDRAARNHSYSCLAPSRFSLDHQASSFAGSARGALPDVSRVPHETPISGKSSSVIATSTCGVTRRTLAQSRTKFECATMTTRTPPQKKPEGP